MTIQERALATWALIWMFSNATLTVFVCERVAYIERDRQTEDLKTTKGDIQKTVFVPACFVIWHGLSIVCFCYVLPICIWTFLLFLFPTWLMCLCTWSMCVRFFVSNCVPATNLCLFSVEPVNARGFLSIFLSASTVWGLILWTNQTIWSLQSYDVLRRMG